MKIRIMKKTAFKFFAMLSLAMFFAGCNNFLNEIDDDKAAASSTKVTLKGSLALEGDAGPGEFFAMAAGGSSRSAVAGGSTMDGYGFVLTATEVDTSSNANPTSINATVTDNGFSIKLDASKTYMFELALNSTDSANGNNSSGLSISKIMFGKEEKSPKVVCLNGLTKAELESAKVYFSPNKTSGTGKIALEINSTTDKVNFLEYSCIFEKEGLSYSLNGVSSFDNNRKAVIEVTKASQTDAATETEIDLPNGIYDFAFEFYESDPETNSNDSPVAIAYQKINVFAGLVTDTWISDGSAYFSEDAGKPGKFTVTQTAIEAYKNPKDFYVNGSAGTSSNESWNGGNDSYAGTSIKKPFNTLQQAIDRVIASNDGESEYKIYVKGTIYPKTYTTTDSTGGEEINYKMANFNALGTEKFLNLSIIGVGNDATLSGKISSDTAADTYGSVVVIGDYDANAPANSTKIPNLNLALENLTIRDGYVGTGWGGPGGGIFNNGATVTLKDCNITENGAWKGSGIYSMNGTIITDNTTIKENTHDENSTGIQLDNSILKVKNTLTLYKNFIVIDGNSTITSDDESGATIKCGATPEGIQEYKLGIYVSASAGDNEEDSTYATLSLSGSLAFEGFTTGVELERLERKEILDGSSYVNGHLTLDGEITNLSVELEDYGLITLENSYSPSSRIYLDFWSDYDSEAVLVKNCKEYWVNTFELSALRGEWWCTMNSDGTLKSDMFAQEDFIAYCKALYETNSYSDTMMFVEDANVTSGDEAYKYVKELVITGDYKGVISPNNKGIFAYREEDSSEYVNNVEKVTLSSGMVNIGNCAFSECDKLKTVIINDDCNIKSIGTDAFTSCSALTGFTIPEGVTEIGDRAFQRCTALTSITIPASVTSIGSNAFYYCSELKTVTMLSETPPDVNSIFYSENMPNEIFVPAGCLTAYQNANGWSGYKDKIKEATE